MKFTAAGRTKKIHARSARIVFTTEDIAKLLGTSPAYVNKLIRDGDLLFTGNSVHDYNQVLARRKKSLDKLSTK